MRMHGGEGYQTGGARAGEGAGSPHGGWGEAASRSGGGASSRQMLHGPVAGQRPTAVLGHAHMYTYDLWGDVER